MNESLKDKNNISEIKYYKLSGILLLSSVVAVFISLIITLIYDITLNPATTGKSLVNVANHPGPHLMSLFFDELSYFLLIALAALLYINFSEYNNEYSLMGAFLVLAGAIILATHNMGNFAITWIAQDYVRASGSEKEALEASAKGILITAKWGVTIGSMVMIAGMFIFSKIIASEKELSRPIGLLGIIGCIFGLIAAPLLWINPTWEQISYALYMPFMIWEFIFGIWLIRK